MKLCTALAALDSTTELFAYRLYFHFYKTPHDPTNKYPSLLRENQNRSSGSEDRIRKFLNFK